MYKRQVLNETCDAGDPWIGIVKKGQTFRILDLEGNQAVDTLFYNANDATERYSAVDTIQPVSYTHLKLLSLAEAKKVFVKADGFKSLYGSTKISDDFNVKYGVYKKPMDIQKTIDPTLMAK